MLARMLLQEGRAFFCKLRAVGPMIVNQLHLLYHRRQILAEGLRPTTAALRNFALALPCTAVPVEGSTGESLRTEKFALHRLAVAARLVKDPGQNVRSQTNTAVRHFLAQELAREARKDHSIQR